MSRLPSIVLASLFWAAVWLLLDGQPTLGALVFALGVGALTTRLADRRGRAVRVLRALPAALRLAAIFLWELADSNLQQLRIVLGPRVEIEPRWIEMESVLETDLGRSLLAILISMTPGTLASEIEGRRIVVHVLDARDPGEAERRIRDQLEVPISRLEERLRPGDGAKERGAR